MPRRDGLVRVLVFTRAWGEERRASERDRAVPFLLGPLLLTSSGLTYIIIFELVMIQE